MLNSTILRDWINPYYLRPSTIQDIRESVWAKPSIKYAVLDGFFIEQKLDELIKHHRNLQFSEALDRRSTSGVPLPYDGAVVWAQPNVHFGSDLFFADAWHGYCATIMHADIKLPTSTEVKLRYHRPDADGFWIHTDSTIRSLVAIWYFNKGWLVGDGGLLQLWRVDEANSPVAFKMENPSGRLGFLTVAKRIRTASPGGGFNDGQAHDLVLIDQIVPTYNRLFVCNFMNEPAYHSVTPSNGRERLGVVQWMAVKPSQGT